MNRIFWLLGISLIPLLTACPGGGGGTTPSLAVSPKTATLTAGTGNATFNATLSNATGAINWSLSPNTGTLSATTGASVTYSPPATAASATTVTLTATSGSLTDTATITVNPPATATISGTVVGFNNQPVPAATVVITGRPPTTTNASGNFTISGVTTPYEIAAVATLGGTNLVTIYKGVTTTNPQITIFAAPGTPKASTGFTGTVGAVAPAFLTTERRAYFVSPEIPGGITNNFNGLTSYNLGTPQWFGPNSSTGTLHVLTWATSGGLPSTYRGYKKQDSVTLANGAATTANISVETLSQNTFSGNITVPASGFVGSYNIDRHVMSLNFAPGELQLLNRSTTDNTFSYVAPNLAATTMTLEADAVDGANNRGAVVKRGIASNATGVTLAIPAPPTLSLPGAGAANINLSTQAFSWAPFAGGVHQLIFVAPGNFITVYTADTSYTLPSTASLGLGTFPTGTSFQWLVFALAPVASVDAVVQPGQLPGLGYFFPVSLVFPRTGDYTYGISNPRGFTTN